MSNVGGAPVLLPLSDAQLTSIARAVTGLAADWAKLAGTTSAHLQRGRDSALKALRTGLLKDPSPYVEAFRHRCDAQLETNGISTALLASTPRELQEALHEVLGHDASHVFQKLTPSRRARGATEDGYPAAPRVDAPESSDDDDGPHIDPEAATVAELRDRIDVLLEKAPELAAVLRSGADAVAAGRPAEAELPRRVEDWTRAVSDLLRGADAYGSADDLQALRDHVEREIKLLEAAQQTAESEQVDRLRLRAAIQTLLEQNLHEYVETLLRTEDYSSLADLDRRIAEGTRSASPRSEVPPPAVGTTAAQAEPDPADANLAPAEELGETLLDVSAETEPAREATETSGAETLAPAKPSGETSVDGSTAEITSEPESHPSGPQRSDPRISRTEMGDGLADETEPQFDGHVTDSALDDGLLSEPSALSSESSQAESSQSRAVLGRDAQSTLPDLVSARREGVAVHAAVALGEPDTRVRLLRFLTAAFCLGRSALEAELARLTLSDAQVEELNTDDTRLCLAASIRSGLTLGYPPLSLQGLLDAGDYAPDDSEFDVLKALVELVQRGWSPERVSASDDAEGLIAEWTDFGRRACELQETLPSRKVKLQRATKVLRHLMRSDEPLGRIVSEVVRLSSSPLGDIVEDSAWESIGSLADVIADDGKRWRLITDADRAVSTTAQLRDEITAGARTKLEGAIGEAGELLQQSLMLRRRQVALSASGTAITDALQKALAVIETPSASSSLGEAAISRLVAAVQAGEFTHTTEAPLEAVLAADLAPLFEIPRDVQGLPLRAPSLPELDALIVGRSSIDVFRGYLSCGNIRAARAERMNLPTTDSALDDELLAATRNARQRHAGAVREVERLASRLLALLEDDLSRDITNALARFRSLPEDRFDVALEPLTALMGRGESRLAELRSTLVARAEVLPDVEAGSRVLDLLTAQDEVLAVEFLTMAESGQALPTIEAEEQDDFVSFFPEVIDVARAAVGNGADSIEDVREALGATSEPSDRQLNHGLKSWLAIKHHKRGNSRESFDRSLADVLRMIGLVPQSERWQREVSKTRRSGYATFLVSASPNDASYVPHFGTQAHGAYDVTLAWDDVSPSKLMSFIDDSRRTNANIIFFFGTLSTAQRLELRRLTVPGRGLGFSPLVIDDAVVAWLSSRREPAFRLTQRVTLPFTTLNPYTPFAGGEVPDEVFVGREDERQRIVSPTGSMFVYGGRQLGKSALLRRVERMYTDVDPESTNGNVAIYIDLKAASIGEALDPAQLWPLLAGRLKQVGVIPDKAGRDIGVDELSRLILNWLDDDQSNRVLLLLDESDNFLTADSKAGRSGSFPTLQSLKSIMERSERRFKPVFAGLHQVQRFHDTSNTPIAHGGQDILIGPLRSQEARQLVVEPMAGLGYEFENQEAVWRLLLYTNYQASLVQIVCEALNKHLQSRPLPPTGGRIIITSADVDDVYASRDVKELIAQRFRWTINLDSRYRLIALTVALRTLDSAPGETFAPADLHDECEVWWPEGFTREELASREFAQYLDEMVGLGVLHRRDEKFGLRSPNIIGLLGTRETLERELAEASSRLELELEYNPTMNRRMMDGADERTAARSPLSDAELTTLTTRDAASASSLRIVAGSPALGLARVAPVLLQAAIERGLNPRLVASHQLRGLVSEQRSRDSFFIVDVTDPIEGTAVSDALQELRRRSGLQCVVVTTVPAWLTVDGTQDLSATFLRRWTIEGLRSWQESPFSSPELRARLHRVTSGWPALVEEAINSVSAGASTEDALERAAEAVEGLASDSDFFTSFGIEPGVAEAWVRWFSRVGSDDLVEAGPASLQDLTEALEQDPRDLLDRLAALDVVEERDTGWVLDRVITAAAAKYFS